MTHTTPLRMVIGISALALCVSAFGETLTPEQALSRALGNAPRALSQSAQNKEYRLVYTQDMPQKAVAGVYIFSSDDAFIAVSADDCAQAVLGYADTSFDTNALPPAMQWWLGEYAREIEAMAGSGAASSAKATVDDKAPIEPLLTTLWNQSSPYNDKCPIINGGRSVTGCVATAMAQVLNYHKYPEVGRGSKTNSLTGETLDFSTMHFDWANMANEYVSNSTQAQKDAVANLMYAAGMSVDMRYSPIESGALSDDIAPALVDNFNYDISLFTAYRNFYGLKDWNNFIYNQLKDYGPVQYSGANANNGGHSFVCDGYGGDGYFHINWGWGGMSDGYFKLTALDPNTQGIGGSALGYNYNQSVIANVSKPRANSSLTPVIYMPSTFDLSPLTGRATGGIITVNSQYANYSKWAITGAPGLKFTAEDGTVAYTYTNGLVRTIASFEAVYQVNMLTPRLEDGTYTVTPVFMTPDNVWHDVRVEVGGIQNYSLTITDGFMTFTPATLGAVTIKDVAVLSTVYFSETFKLSATIENSGDEEYVGTIEPALLDSDKKLVAIAKSITVDLPGKESTQITYTGTFTQIISNVSGEYDLVFLDATSGDVLSEPVAVSVKTSPGQTSVVVENLKIVGTADPENLVFEGTVNCTAGYYGGPIILFICTTIGDVLQTINSEEDAYFVAAGDKVPYRAVGKFTAGTPGKQYAAITGFIDGNSIRPLMKQPYFFTLAVSGIEDVEVENVEVEYYNLQGLKVEKPESGVYIKVSGGKAEKVVF